VSCPSIAFKCVYLLSHADWHGYSESPWYQNLLVGLSDQLERWRWIGVLPFGTAPLPTQTCCPLVGCDEECCKNGEALAPGNACSFNAGGCCGAASNTDEDDVQFARVIRQWLDDNMCVDNDNIFATGFSNGGMIANRLGCQASDIFSAIAPVAGNIRFGGSFTECEPATPVSFLTVCGAEDGVCNSSLDETFARWGRVNECVGIPSTTFESATTHCEAWLPQKVAGGPGCPGNVFVEACVVDDLEHEWSGRPRPDGTSPLQSPANIDATTCARPYSRWLCFAFPSDLPRPHNRYVPAVEHADRGATASAAKVRVARVRCYLVRQ
jgi:hypothetical protein